MLQELAPEWRVALGALLVFTVSLIHHTLRSPWPWIDADRATYEYAGWMMANGQRLYIDIFEIKPPAVFEATAFFSVVVGGDPYLLHALSTVTVVVAGVGICVVIFLLVEQLTGDELAGYVSVVILLAFPAFHFRAFYGFTAKHMMLLFGFAGLYYALNGRYLLAGFLASLSAGFWQFGLIFPVLAGIEVLTRSWQTPRKRESALYYLMGAAAATIIVVGPVVLQGGFWAMIVEVVLVPFYTGEVQSFMNRLAKGVLDLSLFVPWALLGAIGIGQRLYTHHEHRLWLAGLGGWFLLQILVLDYDGVDDLYLGIVVVAIGVGWFYHTLEGRRRRVVEVALALTLVWQVTTLGGVGIIFAPLTDENYETEPTLAVGIEKAAHAAGYADYRVEGVPPSEQHEIQSPYGSEAVPELLFSRTLPDSCHVRLGQTEMQWIERTNSPYMEKECGDWPT